jgi:hypothetical protein
MRGSDHLPSDTAIITPSPRWSQHQTKAVPAVASFVAEKSEDCILEGCDGLISTFTEAFFQQHLERI